MTKVLAACTGGGVGDLLAAMPAISALNRHFNAAVDVLTTSYAAPVIEGQPSVGRILIDRDTDPVNALVEQLRTGHYTHAVVFWSNARIAKALARAGIPIRVGQARRLYSFRYTTRVTVRTELGDTQSHWTDVQMDYARALGAQSRPEDYAIDLKLTARDLAEADALRSRTVEENPFIIWHAARGITARARQWPSENFSVIGDALAGAFGAQVLLTGGSDETALAAAIARNMRQRSFDVSAQTTLRGFTALARQAQLVVALDSGPMHLAAAAGAPTVGIFALRTDLPNRWRPLGPRVAVVGPDYPCPRSCRKETCRTFACYAALSAERVVAAARSILPESLTTRGPFGTVEFVRPTAT